MMRPFFGGHSGFYVEHIYYRVPVTEKLANLLRIYFEQQRDPMALFRWFSLDVRNVEAPARSGIEDAH